MKKYLKIFSLIGLLIFGFFAVEESVNASEGDLLIMGKPVSDVEIFSGSAKGSGKGTELTFLFSEHVGGTFDAACFTEGTYLTLDYTGAENGVYIALVSSSGGQKWTAVYPTSSESIGDNMWRQTYSYETITQIWGDNFARLDIIQVYANVASEITVNRIAYVLGDGAVADTTDGTWDVPMEGIAFIGDSIVQNPIFSYDDWNGILGRSDCVNYGIGGQTTKELKNRIGDVLKGDYEKIIFLCGINDLGKGRQPFVICAAYRDMLDAIKEQCPDTEVIILSVLPTTDAFFKDNQGDIQVLNANLEFMTTEYDFATFVDIYSSFLDENGYGKAEYYTDGLHPNAMGYKIIADILNPYLDERVMTADENADSAEAVSIFIGILVPVAIVAIFVTVIIIVVVVSKKKSKAKTQ